MQTIPATEQALESAENVEDLFDAAYADQVIDLDEARAIRSALRSNVIRACRADIARAIGVCQIRGGVGGPRYLRLMKAWDDLAGMEDEPQDAA